jgi:hypothetical protein
MVGYGSAGCCIKITGKAYVGGSAGFESPEKYVIC